ncbi:hypothetical protein IFM58399_10149, partial [Aspergillus lentulus]
PPLLEEPAAIPAAPAPGPIPPASAPPVGLSSNALLKFVASHSS